MNLIRTTQFFPDYQKSGQLINFKWKIGVALSSSRCSSLLAPYVGIAFDIKHSSGRVSSYTAELSYDEFKVGTLTLTLIP